MNDSNQVQQDAPSSVELRAVGLGRRQGNQELLQDVSFSIQGGDRIALTGPTGSGKSLLLRSLAMLDPIETGEIIWCGENISGSQIPYYRSQVVYLHQRPSLVEGTVEDNFKIPFGLQVHKEREYDREGAVRLLESLGRPESFLSKNATDLSGGELQLTALLRAIQLNPHILLLDEPTAALDSQTTELLESMINTWCEESPTDRAILWVTHDSQQVARVALSTLAMKNGKLSR